ncbi:hypothetical protein KR074_006425 [Drosophila pseudoananassae]|nr:hypothetical protein KR074_006425 [Drosophila pseudoananassae]
MPRKKRSQSPLDFYDDELDEDSQGSQPPVQRNAANARERMRMRVLSSAYGRLKTKLPNIPPDTKLSKLDTLRLATLYIKQLITAVETGSNGSHSHNHSQNHSHNHSHSSTASSEGLDTSHMADASGGANFHFHNNGHGSMSWPFEFHQSNRSLAFPPSTTSSRMEWQTLHAQPYQKSTRSESHVPADLSYHQMSDSSHGHWYAGMEMHQMEQPNSCSYDTSVGQHQRGIAIVTSQSHGI